MIITVNDQFKKSYRTRIRGNSSLSKQVKARIELFTSNPKHPLLRVHQLKGEQREIFAFSVTGDMRILFRYLDSDQVVFIDIGSHNQVY